MPGSNSRPNVSEGYEVPTELPGSTGHIHGLLNSYQNNQYNHDEVLFLGAYRERKTQSATFTVFVNGSHNWSVITDQIYFVFLVNAGP